MWHEPETFKNDSELILKPILGIQVYRPVFGCLG